MAVSVDDVKDLLKTWPWSPRTTVRLRPEAK
jgi:hypothetical protein